MGDIHNILLRVIAQATESQDRVKTPLSLFIFDMHARLKGRDCGRFMELVRSGLAEQEFGRLKSELYHRTDDDCILHISRRRTGERSNLPSLPARSLRR